MNAIPAETIPTTWVEDRDVPFFRLTASIFPPGFVACASVLLAGYDEPDAHRPVPAEDASDLLAIFDQLLRHH